MKNIILFDPDIRDQFLPLTFTRPVGELRIGILTIREKWERQLNGVVSYITQDICQKNTRFTLQKIILWSMVRCCQMTLCAN